MSAVSPRGPFRAVLFDLGNTLVNEKDFNRVERLAEGTGLRVDAEGLAHVFREVEEEFDRGSASTSGEEVWREVVRRCAAAPPTDDAISLFLSALRRDEAPVEVFSDVGRCLDELRERGLALGVVTDGRDEPAARRVLERAHLAPYFRAVVASETEGFAKPDPRIFHRAVERIGSTPERTIYVVDLATVDARAAAAAGLTGVWLHRDGTGWIDDPPEITSLLELPGWIDRAEASAGRSR